MSEVIEIFSGWTRAALAPALGGAVMSLSFSGRDILRRAVSPQAVATDPREAACYPMVPWFSRLLGGLDFASRHYDLAPTLPVCDPVHPLHGHGWVSPWTVTDRAGDRLSCVYEHIPARLLFPFPFRAVQTFAVTDIAFRIDLSVTNTGEAAMPAGLGLHPFFSYRDEAAVVFNQEHITLGDNSKDDSYPDWGGLAHLETDGVMLEITSDAPILHLYAPKAAPFFCAEPVSHLPGRFCETVLQPKETLKIFLNLAFADAPSRAG